MRSTSPGRASFALNVGRTPGFHCRREAVSGAPNHRRIVWITGFHALAGANREVPNELNVAQLFNVLLSGDHSKAFVVEGMPKASLSNPATRPIDSNGSFADTAGII